MKNNKLAALFVSTALVIPGIIASTSNPADAKPTKQEAQKVLQILKKVNNSSGNSASQKSGSALFMHTPGGEAGVNISHSEKKLISKFLDQANCLVQTGGLNPKTGFPIITPRLSCAGTNFKRYTQQRFWVDNGYAKLFYTNGLTFDYYQNQIGLQPFLTQIRRVANGTRWL